MSAHEASESPVRPVSAFGWRPNHWDLLRWPMPHSGFVNRWTFRLVTLLGSRYIGSIHGLEHIQPDNDPFILALNHSSKREAIFLPGALFIHRGGRVIHFMADWNFALYPGIGFLYRRGETITLVQKPARPAFLNRLQPLFAHPKAPLERARAYLEAGESVGIFPEGTVNPDPGRLLRGRLGAAHLSLDTGVPVIPVGIRFPGYRPDEEGQKLPPMEVRIGAPLKPPSPDGATSARRAYDWHVAIMTEVGRLSGKTWGVGEQ